MRWLVRWKSWTIGLTNRRSNYKTFGERGRRGGRRREKEEKMNKGGEGGGERVYNG